MNNTILRSTTRALDARSVAIQYCQEKRIDWRSITTDLIEGRTTIRDHAYDVVAIIEVR